MIWAYIWIFLAGMYAAFGVVEFSRQQITSVWFDLAWCALLLLGASMQRAGYTITKRTP